MKVSKTFLFFFQFPYMLGFQQKKKKMYEFNLISSFYFNFKQFRKSNITFQDKSKVHLSYR